MTDNQAQAITGTLAANGTRRDDTARTVPDSVIFLQH